MKKFVRPTSFLYFAYITLKLRFKNLHLVLISEGKLVYNLTELLSASTTIFDSKCCQLASETILHLSDI